jgi:outer membrane murein-binding lipoprotein Lpp
MNNRVIFIAVAATGFALAGCDSRAENEVEEQATAIDEAYEADADLEEAMTEGGPDEKAGEAKADALREEGEETKDRLEDEADEMDAAPQ